MLIEIDTKDGLSGLAAMHLYSRMRFILNLLPLISAASGLRRIVTVVGGTLEGAVDPNDFPGKNIPVWRVRSHVPTVITLGLEAVVKRAPEVSIVHCYPGTVKTEVQDRIQGVYPILGTFLKFVTWVFGRWIVVPLEECGERHLFLATSARYPPRVRVDEDSGAGVLVGEGVEVARGTDGVAGSGVYSVGWDCESASSKIEKLLEGYREKGMVEDIWRHVESEFKRIEGS